MTQEEKEKEKEDMLREKSNNPNLKGGEKQDWCQNQFKKLIKNMKIEIWGPRFGPRDLTNWLYIKFFTRNPIFWIPGRNSGVQTEFGYLILPRHRLFTEEGVADEKAKKS